MPKDVDDIYKKLDQHSKSYEKDSTKLNKEISDLKKEIRDIGFKVDTMLEILNSFTIMLAEDDEDLEEDYEFDSDETWVPKEEKFWENDDDSV